MSELINELRKRKVAGIAVFDLAGTAAVAVLVANRYEVSKVKMVFGFLMFGEAVHVALGVSTPVTRKLLNKST
jgi:hypothetical protein